MLHLPEGDETHQTRLVEFTYDEPPLDLDGILDSI